MGKQSATMAEGFGYAPLPCNRASLAKGRCRDRRPRRWDLQYSIVIAAVAPTTNCTAYMPQLFKSYKPGGPAGQAYALFGGQAQLVSLGCSACALKGERKYIFEHRG